MYPNVCTSYVWLSFRSIMSQWATAIRESSFVAVNHRDKGKFLRRGQPQRQRKIPSRSEPLLWRKIPILQWTTATKDTYLVAVNHRDKKKLHCFETKTQILNKSGLCHKMGMKTEKSMYSPKKKFLPSNI